MASFKVDYKVELPNALTKINEIATNLNNELINCYKEVEGLHSSWTWDRYKELIQAFNAKVESLNSVLTSVVEEIPHTISQVICNYTNADTHGNMRPQDTKATKLSPIEVSEDSMLQFDTTVAEIAEENVNKHFSRAEEYMTTIANVVNGLNWEGGAAENCKSTISNAKNTVTNTFNDLREEFVKAIASATADLQQAENISTFN